MELSKEIIETGKFTPEQVEAVKTFGESYVATLKKEYDDTANKNAEGVLEGAVKYFQTKTGVNEPRQQGEKYGDYINRISSKAFESQKTALDAAKAEYEQKMKDFKGGDLLKADLDKAKAEYDELLKKTADYEDVKKKATDFDELSKNYSSLKIGTAFRDVKPTFPETVNSYEAAAKWGEFEKKVLEAYDVEIVDGKGIAIDKTNRHRQVKLEELVKAESPIQDLLAGRQQKGPNGQPITAPITIEGVPFAVPEKATTEERAKLIREHLTKEGLDPTTSDYSNKFSELNKKIIAGGK